jgi:ribonuclease HI
MCTCTAAISRVIIYLSWHSEGTHRRSHGQNTKTRMFSEAIAKADKWQQVAASWRAVHDDKETNRSVAQLNQEAARQQQLGYRYYG